MPNSILVFILAPVLALVANIVFESGALAQPGASHFSMTAQSEAPARYPDSKTLTAVSTPKNLAPGAKSKNPASEQRLQAAKAFERANKAYKAQDVRGAAALINKAIDLDPTVPAYFLTRGTMAMSARNYPAALADLNRAISIDPDCGMAYFTRALVYSAEDNLKPAISDFKQALKYRDMPVQAIKDRLASLEPKQALRDRDTTGFWANPQCISRRLDGMKKMHEQDYEGAAKDFAKLAEIAPKSDIGHTLLGNALAKQDLHDQAMKQYNLACSMNNHSQAFLERGQAYIAVRDFPRAIADLEKCAKEKIGIETALRYLGECYFITKDYAKSIKAMDQVIVLQPQNTGHYLSRGESFLKLKRYRESIADFTKMIDLNPKIAAGYVERAKAYKEMGRDDLAQKDLHTVSRISDQLESDLFPKTK